MRAELEKRVPLTRAEEGCLQYDLHLDRDDPTHFVFYEKWASREVLQAHINSHPVAAYMKATDGAVRKVLFDEMEAI